MKITKISIFQVDLPVKDGGFKQSSGRVWRTLDSSIIRIDTDTGLSGWGETTPFGANYLPAFAEGARGGMAVMAPFLLGQDPRSLTAVNMKMDEALYGQPYAKTGIDIACWDILGKATNLPIYTLLGGKLTDPFPISGFFSIDPSETTADYIREMQENYPVTYFEFKGSGDPHIDIEMLQFVGHHLKPGVRVIIDVNQGWQVQEALRVSEATRGLDILFEQPCATYEECRSFKRATGRPVSLDECIHSVRDLVRAYSEGVIDVLNLKIGRIGGLTRSRELRDLAVSFGIPCKVQDTSGSEFNAAATAHLAHSTPPRHVLSIWDCADFVTLKTGSGLVRSDDPNIHGQRANDQPGLGVTPFLDVLGEPVAIYE